MPSSLLITKKQTSLVSSLPPSSALMKANYNVKEPTVLRILHTETSKSKPYTSCQWQHPIHEHQKKKKNDKIWMTDFLSWHLEQKLYSSWQVTITSLAGNNARLRCSLKQSDNNKNVREHGWEQAMIHTRESNPRYRRKHSSHFFLSSYLIDGHTDRNQESMELIQRERFIKRIQSISLSVWI